MALFLLRLAVPVSVYAGYFTAGIISAEDPVSSAAVFGSWYYIAAAATTFAVVVVAAACITFAAAVPVSAVADFMAVFFQCRSFSRAQDIKNIQS